MADEGFKRKLAAILSADVEGYSRLMEDDEEATVRTLPSYRTAITDLVQQFRGRIVDTPGDNILAEFISVVDSVNCAVEIQRELAERNAELPNNRRMMFRIGVNLGDVIEEEGRIYGDGVNIAARVESLAEAGGICISGRVHDQVENKLGLEYKDLGKHEVKNISRPIQVYRVLSYPGAAKHRVVKVKETLGRKWRNIGILAAIVVVVVGALAIWQFYMRRPTVEPASEDKMAFPLPDNPSIAVLAFDNLSGDPNQEYFSDGITEDIITALSKTPKMFVIARNSTFTYKGKPVKVQQVAEELGVRYVLEGSVRKVGEKVRINAQLIDAKTGHHLWAEKYDRELKDIFVLQDEITKSIITELQVKLTEGEQARVRAKGTDSLEVYLKVIEARQFVRGQNIEQNRKARKLLEEAIELDPNYAPAYRWLASTHFVDVFLGTSKSPRDSLKKTVELSKKALSIDDSLGDAHAVIGFVKILTKQYENGMSELKKAVELYPNGADSHAFLAAGLLYTDKLDEAILVSKKAIRLNPMAPSWYFNNLGAMYRCKGNYKEALVWSEKAVKQAPEYIIGRIHLSSIYSLLGRMDEAHLQADEVMKLNPKFYVKKLERTLPYKNAEVKKRYIEALRNTGLPYEPPLPLPVKPSIAVLAFDNLSGDPEQEYFSDGISEDIITALSKTPKIFVIARNSSFTYKGKPVKVQQVGRDLGVRYVLEGSARKAGEKVRITAQLIDAKTGHHIWADNYDRDLIDLFAVQDELTKNIISAMQVKLTLGEQARVDAQGTNNLQAYLKFLQARENVNRFNSEGNALGKRLAQEAIDLDPQYAMAYRILAATHRMDVFLGTSKSPKESISMCFKLLNKSLELDETYAEAYGALGFTYSMVGKHDQAVATAQKAVALDPNSANTYAMLGHTLRMADRPEEAIPAYKKAIRLNPIPPTFYLFGLGMSYSLAGQHEKGIEWCKKAVQQAPDDYIARIFLTTAYSMGGQLEDARAEVPEVLRINPKFSLAKAEKRANYKFKDKMFDALRKVGLPE